MTYAKLDKEAGQNQVLNDQNSSTKAETFDIEFETLPVPPPRHHRKGNRANKDIQTECEVDQAYEPPVN